MPAGGGSGVVAARLEWRRNASHRRLLSESGDASLAAQALVIDAAGIVAVGPVEWRGRHWDAAPLPDQPAFAEGPRFERLSDRQYVVRAPVETGAAASGAGWQVQLSEPRQLVFARADALGRQILWISFGLAPPPRCSGRSGRAA